MFHSRQNVLFFLVYILLNKHFKANTKANKLKIIIKKYFFYWKQLYLLSICVLGYENLRNIFLQTDKNIQLSFTQKDEKTVKFRISTSKLFNFQRKVSVQILMSCILYDISLSTGLQILSALSVRSTCLITATSLERRPRTHNQSSLYHFDT